MKICILGDGESIHTIRWCKQFQRMGHEIHLVSLKHAAIDGIVCHFLDAGNIRVAGGNWRILFHAGKLKQLMNEIRPDVVHALYATSYGMLGARSGFHPFIVTPLGSDVLVSPKQSIFYRLLLRYVLKRADVVTAIAPHIRQAVLELGCEEQKIKDIVFGIDTRLFCPNADVLPGTVFTISSIRNFEPIYNLDIFLEAIAKFRTKVPDFRVVMTGDGSLRQELEQLAKKLDIAAVISFRGRVSQPEIIDVLRRSHVSVSVSSSDGNNLSLLEAMACGAYPVATDIPANRAWIKPEVNGTLVNVRDVDSLVNALLDVHENYSLYNKRAQEYSKDVLSERGDWEKNMEQMNRIYLKLQEHA